MKKSNQEKLAEIRAKKEAKIFRQRELEQKPIKDLESSISELRVLLGRGIEIKDLDNVLDQLRGINQLKDVVVELNNSIDKISKSKLPTSIKIDGLGSLLTAIKDIKVKAPDVKINSDNSAQLRQISILIIDLTRLIKNNIPEKSQKPDDFMPVRRVIQIGRVLQFDDVPTQHHSGMAGGTAPGIAPGLINTAFDTIQITSYNANNDPLIVVYRLGGASGTIVATLNISYDGSYNITQVVKT